jgi:hypothetical protein
MAAGIRPAGLMLAQEVSGEFFIRRTFYAIFLGKAPDSV